MIDHATIERIKDAANIVEVVSEVVTLRRSGANYKGLCPFHDAGSWHVSLLWMWQGRQSRRLHHGA